MPAKAELAARFAELERIVEAQPEGVTTEIAIGVFHMTPRSRLRNLRVQGALFQALNSRLGSGRRARWMFVLEPEVRDEIAGSRLIPDVAAWGVETGFPDLELSLVPLAPVWVAEILSPTTEDFDRGEKLDAYGLMGVVWVWLVDVKKRRVEVYENVNGRMTLSEARGETDRLDAPPFEGLDAMAEEIFAV